MSFLQNDQPSLSASSSAASAAFRPLSLSEEKASATTPLSSERLASEASAMSLVKMFTTESNAEQTSEKFITTTRIATGLTRLHPAFPPPSPT